VTRHGRASSSISSGFTTASGFIPRWVIELPWSSNNGNWQLNPLSTKLGQDQPSPLRGEGQGEGECLPFLLLERIEVRVDYPLPHPKVGVGEFLLYDGSAKDFPLS
jgi:hypothetical protein